MLLLLLPLRLLLLLEPCFFPCLPGFEEREVLLLALLLPLEELRLPLLLRLRRRLAESLRSESSAAA